MPTIPTAFHPLWYDLVPREALLSGETWWTDRPGAMIAALRLTVDFLRKRLDPDPRTWTREDVERGATDRLALMPK